jgi:2-polyprenyl-3-methyl-5-hydroxy-6-metoxy-1,4-benzoquinol methylase
MDAFKSDATSAQARHDLALDEDWYHTIELKPDVFTPGKSYSNVALTRRILKACPIEGAVCLDVGAMDGMISAILHRRGARRVIACDRYDRRRHIGIVSRCLGADIDYVGRVTLAEMRRLGPQLVGDPFDVIVFSGVLYHMYDPMNALALVRSMVRPGGIVVVESQAILTNKMVGYFNAAGSIDADQHNYWNMSVALLDYLFRYFRLKPLDCSYFTWGSSTEDGCSLARVCVACEAVTSALPDEGDQYMIASLRDDDAEYPEWAAERRDPLQYAGSCSPLVRRPSGAVDLYRTITSTPPIVWGEEDVRLALAARG